MNQITDKLWVGDIGDAREGDTSRFDIVVSACQDGVAENVACFNAVFRLADGIDNERHYGGTSDYAEFAIAADYVCAQLVFDNTVLVHCHAGVSRSPAVAAAALARYEQIGYDEALGKVGERHPPTNPHSLLKAHVHRYVNETVG